MILHCEICSRMGTRLTTTSRIAKIKDGAKHPLKAEDFIAILGDRPDDERLGQMWMSGAPWDRMLHYNHHRPWANEPEEADAAIRNGGPQTIYVEDLKTGYLGKAKVTKQGIEISRTGQRTREIYTDEELKEEWMKRKEQTMVIPEGSIMIRVTRQQNSESEQPEKQKRRGRPKGSKKKKNV